ncbi:MAG: M20 metallopeptidase family protein [Planctomycetota bacterium]|jgi:amidohydrolase
MRSALLTSVLVGIVSPGVHAGPLCDSVTTFQDEIIAHRHTIHQNPELGNREFKTAELVANHLRSLNFDEVITGVAHTGVVGILRGGKPGPTIAVRADMDALPVTENTDLPFASTVRTTFNGKEVGVMHACGHDIHTSVQLGVASILATHRDDMPGTVVFIFQPAEEGTPKGENGGAKMMLEEGIFERYKPEVVFGLHSTADAEVGQVSYTTNAAMASVDWFYITIKGKQSHGAQPQASVDPIVMGAQAVEAFQTIHSRNIHPLDPAVITVGIFRGGERANIIPSSVYLEGTVRTYSPRVQEQIETRMREILDGITSAAGGSFDFEYERYTPVVINNEELTARMLPTLQHVLGEENVFERKPTMGGEDFAYFANEVPGFFFFLGTREPGGESGGVHTPTFRAMDEAVPTGMHVMMHVLWDYLVDATN